MVVVPLQVPPAPDPTAWLGSLSMSIFTKQVPILLVGKSFDAVPLFLGLFFQQPEFLLKVSSFMILSNAPKYINAKNAVVVVPDLTVTVSQGFHGCFPMSLVLLPHKTLPHATGTRLGTRLTIFF